MAVNPTFGVDDYKRVKVQSEKETIVNDMLMILYGKPGFYPSIPSLGMNIREYLYRPEDEVNTDQIKSVMRAQCNDFGDYIDDGSLDVVKTTYLGETLIIFILPEVDDNGEKLAALGVTLNSKKELVYNFIENMTQTF